jgi:hypothetical protein
MGSKNVALAALGLGGILLLVGVFTTSWYTFSNSERGVSASVGLKTSGTCEKGKCETMSTATFVTQLLGGEEEEVKPWLKLGLITYWLSLIAGILCLIGVASAATGKAVNLPVAPERLGALLAAVALITAILFVAATRKPEAMGEFSLGFSAFAGLIGAALGAGGLLGKKPAAEGDA